LTSPTTTSTFVQAELVDHRAGSLDARPVEVHARHPPGGPDRIGHHCEPADRTASAFDDTPAPLDTDAIERGPRDVPSDLEDAQQAPQVLIAPVEDVAPGTV
jgi:hypothetical protein